MTSLQGAGRARRANTPRVPLAGDPHLSLYLLIAACVAADLSFVPLLPGLRASRGRSYRCQVRVRLIPKPGLPHMMVVETAGRGGVVSARSAWRELKTSRAM